MKRPFFTMLMVIVMMTAVHAQQIQRLSNGTFIPAGSSDTISINPSDIMIYHIPFEEEDLAHDITWQALGDLTIIGLKETEEGTDSSTVYVASTSRTGRYPYGYGKGRLRVFYYTKNSGICGAFMKSVDIYKEFGEIETVKIVGNSCINTNDTVTYSIDPLVSVNLNAEIGLDRYKWEIPDGWNALFYSGDSSSITFKVGEMDTTGNALKADIGKVNFNDGFTYELALRPDIDKPLFEIPPMECLPLGDSSFTVALQAVPGLKYEWSFGIGTNWTLADGYDSADTEIVVVVADNDPGELILKIKGKCDTPLDTTFVINRSIDQSNTLEGETCVAAGDVISYSVTDANVPIKWFLPEGWDYNGSNHSSNTITLVAGVKSGTLRATSAECVGDTLFLDVSVTPAKPETPEGETCFVSNFSDSVTYTVAAVLNATGYYWTFPSSFEPRTLVTTAPSATVMANAFTGTGYVSVYAIGCENSSTSSLPVSYKPTTPNDLSGTTCIGLDELSNYFTYTVSPQTDVTFNWQIPSGWNFSSSTHTGNSISISPANHSTGGLVTVAAQGCATTASDSLYVYIEGDGGYIFGITPISVSGLTIYSLTSTPSFSFAGAESIIWSINETTVQTGNSSFVLYDSNCTSGTLSVKIVDEQSCVNTSTSTTISCASGSSTLARSEAGTSEATNSLEVYPNPTSDEVVVVLPDTESSYEIQLFSTDGKELLKLSSADKTQMLDLQEYPAGTYILTVKDGVNHFSKRIIKE